VKFSLVLVLEVGDTRPSNESLHRNSQILGLPNRRLSRVESGGRPLLAIARFLLANASASVLDYRHDEHK
jgi:hypothetical protein